MLECHPDWVPSLRLGNDEQTPTNAQRCINQEEEPMNAERRDQEVNPTPAQCCNHGGRPVTSSTHAQCCNHGARPVTSSTHAQCCNHGARPVTSSTAALPEDNISGIANAPAPSTPPHSADLGSALTENTARTPSTPPHSAGLGSAVTENTACTPPSPSDLGSALRENTARTPSTPPHSADLGSALTENTARTPSTPPRSADLGSALRENAARTPPPPSDLGSEMTDCWQMGEDHGELYSSDDEECSGDGLYRRRKLACWECGEKFPCRYTLMTHYKSHDARATCHICRVTFSRKLSLHTHLTNAHAHAMPVRCAGGCFRLFGDPHEYNNHKATPCAGVVPPPRFRSSPPELPPPPPRPFNGGKEARVDASTEPPGAAVSSSSSSSSSSVSPPPPSSPSAPDVPSRDRDREGDGKAVGESETEEDGESLTESRAFTAMEADRESQTDSRPCAAMEDESQSLTESRAFTATDTDSGSQTGSQTDSRAFTAMEDETAMEASESQTQSRSFTATDADSESRTRSRAYAAVEDGSGSQTESQTESQTGSRLFASTGADSESQTESRAFAAMEDETAMEDESESQSRPFTATAADSESQTESRPLAAVEDERESQTESRPLAAVEDERESQTESRPLAAVEDERESQTESRPLAAVEDERESQTESQTDAGPFAGVQIKQEPPDRLECDRNVLPPVGAPPPTSSSPLANGGPTDCGREDVRREHAYAMPWEMKEEEEEDDRHEWGSEGTASCHEDSHWQAPGGRATDPNDSSPGRRPRREGTRRSARIATISQASQRDSSSLMSPLSSPSSSDHSDVDPDWGGGGGQAAHRKHLTIGPINATCVLCGRGPFKCLSVHKTRCPVKRGDLTCCHCQQRLPSEKDLLEHKVIWYGCALCRQIFPYRAGYEVHACANGGGVVVKPRPQPFIQMSCSASPVLANINRCHLCDAFFSASRDLLNHKVEAHSTKFSIQVNLPPGGADSSATYPPPGQSLVHHAGPPPPYQLTLAPAPQQPLLAAPGSSSYPGGAFGQVTYRHHHPPSYTSAPPPQYPPPPGYPSSSSSNPNKPQLKIIAIFQNTSRELALQKRLATPWRSKTPYSCRQCGAVSRQPSLAVAHRYLHRRRSGGGGCRSRGRPYRCDGCGRAFLRRLHLLRHCVRHADTTGYVCAGCGESFYGARLLARHVQAGRRRRRTPKAKTRKTPRRGGVGGGGGGGGGVGGGGRGGRGRDKTASTVGTECRRLDAFSCEDCGEVFARASAYIWHRLKNEPHHERHPNKRNEPPVP